MAVEALEPVHEALGVEPADVVHHLGVERVGFGGGTVVTEVARRDQQRVAPLERADERTSEQLRFSPFLAPHQDRHDAHLGNDVLQERELHLERVLVAVRAHLVDDSSVVGHEPGRNLLVDGHPPERRLERTARRHRHAVEGHPVGRPDEDRGEAGPPAQQRIGVGGDRPGVAQPRMGADERDASLSSDRARSRTHVRRPTSRPLG